MNKKYVKIALFSALGIGAIYGGYKLITFLRDKKMSDDPIQSNEIETTTASTPSFDENKEVKKGSKGSEVKTIQVAFNNIIEDAKKIKFPNGDLESRRNDVAGLTKLTTDGIFGSKTLAVCQKIMGASSTTYAKVRQKRLDFAKVYGLGNPYEKK